MESLNIAVVKTRIGDFTAYWGEITVAHLLERVDAVPEEKVAEWREEFDDWCYGKRMDGRRAEFPFPYSHEPGHGTIILAFAEGEAYYAPLSLYWEDEGQGGVVDGKLGVLSLTGQKNECLICYGGRSRLQWLREELDGSVGLRTVNPDTRVLVMFFDGRMPEEEDDAP